ncbi:MAG: IS21 family transposase [Fibrobacterota bacterium]
MRKIKEVLRLHFDKGLSLGAISRACGIGRTTTHRYLKRFKASGLSWPLPDDIDEQSLNARLFHKPVPPVEKQDLPDWQHVHQELSRKGVTLRLLWEEYRQLHPEGYAYSHYCNLYRTWRKRLKVTLRQAYKAGEKLFVDYAGMTVDIINPETGEVSKAQIFACALGASHYMYAEASPGQDLESWITSHTNALRFYGGVPEIVIPDNLKSGVRSPCLYEPDINPTYQEWAEHFGVAVIPARVKKPRDKAKAETAVQIVERRILAPLRNRTFFSIEELNHVLWEKLDELNNTPMQGMDKSRRELFKLLDKPALNPLPRRDYEIAQIRQAKVNLDYHIEVEKHYYSVPYTLAHKRVEVRYTRRIVEIFHQGRRIASHPRCHRPYRHTTQYEHMPKAHQEVVGWTPEKFTNWAGMIGPATLRMIEAILSSRLHPQQGFRSCLGLLRLEKAHGKERLEKACERALHFNLMGRRHVLEILKKKQDRLELPCREASSANHVNIRGSKYFQ